MEYLKPMIDEETLKARIQELAVQINNDYKGKNPILICILKGAIYFFTDLTKNINIDCEFDFMRISSYEGEKSTGQIEIKIDLDRNVEGRDLIIVEDIIDTGKSLSGLIKHLEKKKPNSIKLCVLLDKPDRREVHDINPDYTGFIIPNEFVVGYGLDYDEKYRNIPCVNCIIKEKDDDLDNNNINIKSLVNKNNLH